MPFRKLIFEYMEWFLDILNETLTILDETLNILNETLNILNETLNVLNESWICWMKLWICWMKLWMYGMKLWIYGMKVDWRQTSRKCLRPSCLTCRYCSNKRMTMSQSARNLIGGINNTLANACTGQNPPANPAQYRSSDEEVRSLFNRGRPTTTGQAAVYQANLSMPSTSQDIYINIYMYYIWYVLFPKCRL